MPNVVAIAQDHTALKLGLAGVHVHEVSDVKEAEQQLTELLESDTNVVIVQEDLREQFSEWFSTQLSRHRGLPLVVYCPSFEAEESNADAYINAVLKPAVGFEIRLED
jgi:vacuolar-type H+-ATPase subunit F/Vma7